MDPSASITIDDSLWPLLQVKFPSAFTNAQQERYLGQLLTYLRRGERYVGVMDTHLLKNPSAEQRQRQAHFIKEHEALFRQCSLGTAGIVTSPLMALGARILIHLKPMPTPFYVASSLPAAVSWAAERLELAGLSEPAERVRCHFGLLPARRTG
ncbi:hypothetical protein ATI61_112277 [Archangium gephyra]|uniref:Uncharacterized protein n=1 Tax=Archangium gephyra TaxID=48 RepID=A0AAC8TCR0_9BACT|nr:hypothetical protein [Archangium gephyra]AKJ01017.1 Hypothetical protein AA314_02643 [Archangium gephyra]REG26182.1 hypothetical protein ATI61_112277 [Archangium gephyra]